MRAEARSSQPVGALGLILTGEALDSGHSHYRLGPSLTH